MNRRALDAYYTPDDVARLCVSALRLNLEPAAITVVEPSVGGGAFARSILEAKPNAHTIGIDIDPNADGLVDVDDPIVGGFVDVNFGAYSVDWVIGNPPFSHAEEHARHALGLAPRVALLLRLAFLESKRRVPFWAEHPAAEVHVLSRRPSFTGGGTDSCAYAWFVWDRRHRGPTHLLHLS